MKKILMILAVAAILFAAFPEKVSADAGGKSLVNAYAEEYSLAMIYTGSARGAALVSRSGAAAAATYIGGEHVIFEHGKQAAVVAGDRIFTK